MDGLTGQEDEPCLGIVQLPFARLAWDPSWVMREELVQLLRRALLRALDKPRDAA
jgi:hypothetical protein